MSASSSEERRIILLEKYGGILPVFEIMYIQSIMYSADKSVNAFRGFDEAILNCLEADLVFAKIQEALAHAGALSRFFWPMKSNNSISSGRGLRLRQSFKIAESSSLKHRHLRNAFEHFDEDLDKFLLEGKVGYFFPSPIVGEHDFADDELSQIFKLVDPFNGVCVLLGKKFDFRPIQEEVELIFEEAVRKNNTGGRL